MAARYWIILGGFALAALVTALLLGRPHTAGGQTPGLPDSALVALREGRYLRATQIIRAALQGVRDTTPETILTLARAEAGWGGWTRTRALLQDRPWLDRVAGATGRELLGRARLTLGDPAAAARDFARYLEAGRPDQRERAATLVREGQAWQQAHDEAAALQAYDRAARALPSISPWVLLLAAGAAADAGDTAQLRGRLDHLPAALARDRGWALSVQALARVGDTASAIRAAEQAASTLPAASARATAWQVAGDLLSRTGNPAAALQAFGRALKAAPGSSGATAAARSLLLLPAATPEERFRAGLALLDAGDAILAAGPIRAYLANGHVSRERRSTILLQLGEGLFASRRYAEAIATLRAAAEGAAPTAAAALYTIARARVRLGRTRDARATLLRLVELYPGQAAASSGLFLLGDLDQDAGRLASARSSFRRVTESSGSRAVVGDAFMRLGEMALTARDYRRALEIYQAYLRRYPAGKHADAANFWIARAELRLGRTPAGRARLEQLRRGADPSYYTVRAAQLLERPVLPPMTVPAPAAESGGDEPRVAADRVQLLDQLGLGDAAAAETDTAEARFARNEAALYDFAEELNARGLTSAGISIGWELRRRAGGWNLRLLRIVYPFPYRPTVVADSRARGLDPYLVAGLIRQESHFMTTARSRAGALGLMQVLPGTGRTLARALGGPDAGYLLYPGLNVYLGTTFLAELLRQTDGNLPEMLAAYNAGPARLRRWRRFPEARDPDLFAERIPFDETRDYVRIVQANARIYAALYPGLSGSGAAGA